MSAVVCFVHTRAADADVVSATEELQASLVDGTQRQRRTGAAGAAQGVPGEGQTLIRKSRDATTNTRPLNGNSKCTGAGRRGRTGVGQHACCRSPADSAGRWGAIRGFEVLLRSAFFGNASPSQQ